MAFLLAETCSSPEQYVTEEGSMCVSSGLSPFIKTRARHNSPRAGRLRWGVGGGEGAWFKACLGCIVRPCSKTKINK
jgi:hypothetical protein